ncbi:MAG: methyl-accepting chemotaxis protein [Clostridiales Family XIII bacterium]|jgi:methyl-accepting chemotaxis protein|nr:methyl-accepting chemotaxis protein [Clostridiales Family XIII bacterium]
MKNQSIRNSILFPVISVLIVGILAMVLILNYQTSRITADLSEHIVTEAAARYASDFQSIGNENYGSIAAIAPIIEGLSDLENAREEAVAQFKDVLAVSKSMLAIWCVYEPDAFDGKDAQFANTLYHDSSGRFVPYVVNTPDGIDVEALVGYDDPIAGDYYQGAKKTGKPYMSDPYYYKVGTEEKLVSSIAIPIVQNGKVIGAVGLDIDMTGLVDKMNAGKILDDGYIITFSPSGLVATHSNPDDLLTHYRDNWMSIFESDFEEIAANGGTKYASGYSPSHDEEMIFAMHGVNIGDTEQYWNVCAIVPRSDVDEAGAGLSIVIIAVGVVLILLVSIIIFIIIRKLLADLPKLTSALDSLASGDIAHLSLDKLTEEKTDNEIALLARSFGRMVESIQKQVDAVQALADGDLTVAVVPESELDALNIALAQMVESTNHVFREINNSAQSVTSGSQQMTNGALLLSQSTTEQAASIEELSAEVSEIADLTKKNEELAKSAAALSASIKDSAQRGGEQIQKLSDAVKEINESSSNIEKVIKVIEDIAFQTNILALNAAVEAARAGQHGKGFAVVADEVRNLAAKSTLAAQETGALISNSVEKATLGVSMAESTSESFAAIMEGINETNEYVKQIPKASMQQSAAIENINIGLEQITNAIQQNSATAEETAAASEEMNNQATLLYQLIRHFKIK